MKFEVGDTILYINIKGFLSKIQHKVLGTNISHTSTICGRLEGISSIPIELEVDIKVRIHSYQHDPNHREIWRWNTDFIPQEIIDRVVNDYRKRYEDHWYGFIQWLTIGIRRLLETTLPKKYRGQVKKWNILWGWGTVCSELLYYIDKTILDETIKEWLEKMVKAHPSDNRREMYKVRWFQVGAFRDAYYHYNPNTFTPKDQQLIYKSNDFLSIKRKIW